MNILIYSLFFSVFLLDFLHFDLRIIPRSVTWLPELLSIYTLLVIALRFAVKKEFAIQPKYIYLILVHFLTLVLGFTSNNISPGGIFIGIRNYLKHFPFFLLPAVYNFSDEEFRKQLRFILPLLMLQCPLALYQRLIQYRGILSGDPISGTLDVSSFLSITLISSIAVVVGMYLKKKMHLSRFLIIAFCLFLPTTLNETKGTLFLLPIALVLPAFFSQESGRSKIKGLLAMSLIGIILISIFVPIYDHFTKPRWGFGVLEFFQKEDRLEKYLYSRATGRQGEELRRGDTIFLAYRNLSKNVNTLLFGLGMGNVTPSPEHFLKNP